MSSPSGFVRSPTRNLRPSAAAGRRRARVRTACRVGCALWLRDARTKGRRVLHGYAVNLSTSGLAVQVGEYLPVGTPIESIVLHPMSEPLCNGAAVRHVRRVLSDVFELGIEVSSGQAAAMPSHRVLPGPPLRAEPAPLSPSV